MIGGRGTGAGGRVRRRDRSWPARSLAHVPPPDDLTGLTMVITGASSGIGAAAARRLASLGAIVVPVGRSPEKTAAVAAELGVEPLIADFSRLDDVRVLAAQLLERCPHIDVLAHNAGGTFPRRVITVDGHETTFQVNHLAPFLLTTLLAERLATPGCRVITTSSAANRLGHVRLGDLDNRRFPYVGMAAYCTAKLENILFTTELSRRLKPTGGTATCFHPGTVATSFAHSSPVVGLIYRTQLRKVLLVPVEQGAEPLVHLASRPDPEAVDGRYVDRFRPDGATSRQARDPVLARKLWDRSVELLGIDPDVFPGTPA